MYCAAALKGKGRRAHPLQHRAPSRTWVSPPYRPLPPPKHAQTQRALSYMQARFLGALPMQQGQHTAA